MNSRTALFFQAIRGPVLLIVIGSLFATQQAGGARVSQTWPLVLIVYGLLRLLERVYAPAPPMPGAYVPPPTGGYAPPPPAGGQPYTPPPYTPPSSGGGFTR